MSDTGKVELDPTVDFVAGTISGMASLVVGFPFDTVKVRFQNPETASKYRSTFHAITTIIREEKFIGLYKGITSPLASVALMNGLVFASYRFFMKVQLASADSIPTLTQIALAGAGSGIVSSIVTTPTELIKIRQQSMLTPTNARKVALQIIKESGMRGLYRGITPTALRDIGYGAYFSAYEATCRYFSPAVTSSADNLSLTSQVQADANRLSWPVMLLAGGVAGIAGWIATFPFDVVKTRVQGSKRITLPNKMGSAVAHGSSSTAATPLLANTICSTRTAVTEINPYQTTLSTIIYSYRTEGPGVFFRGLVPTLVRAIPVNMVTFTTFEAIVHALS
ncbi:carnitine/acyl carnitine carrier [Crucibulum laeve]|uniref:Carnitine/acyl carnitine carrier n=1 Tax=Crucibulum laeve TaxID=68775 RepID=A0A5C3LLP1_9AGAR|nr:carnitine/acyl carnitine carrier [Crucibulum laeve]